MKLKLGINGKSTKSVFLFFFFWGGLHYSIQQCISDLLIITCALKG